MFVKSAIAGVLAIGSVAAADVAVSEAAFGFTIAFPAKPQRVVPAAEDLADWGMKRGITYELQNQTGYYSVMAAQPLADDQRFASLPDALASIRGMCQTEGKKLSESGFAVPRGLGIEVRVARSIPMGGEPTIDVIRFAARDNKLFCVRGTASDAKNLPTAERFVRSFALK